VPAGERLSRGGSNGHEAPRDPRRLRLLSLTVHQKRGWTLAEENALGARLHSTHDTRCRRHLSCMALCMFGRVHEKSDHG
jgi:hypothetical protein